MFFMVFIIISFVFLDFKSWLVFQAIDLLWFYFYIGFFTRDLLIFDLDVLFTLSSSSLTMFLKLIFCLIFKSFIKSFAFIIVYINSRIIQLTTLIIRYCNCIIKKYIQYHLLILIIFVSNKIQMNREIINACQLFKSGKLMESLEEYNNALQKNSISGEFNINKEVGIKCTMGVIYMSLGNQQKAEELFRSVIQDSEEAIDETILIRAQINLILIELMGQKYISAIDKFEQVCDAIEKSQNHEQLVMFVYNLLFRVNSIEELNNLQQIQKQWLSNNADSKMKLMETVSLSSLMRSKDICDEGVETRTVLRLQCLCYHTFISHRRYDYGMAALRHILSLDLSRQEQEQYRKQLNKIIMTGLVDNVEIQNQQIVETMKEIYQRLKSITIQPMLPKDKLNQQIKLRIIKYAIYFSISKIKLHQMSFEDRDIIQKTAEYIKKQNNPLIIKQLTKTQFAKKSIAEFRTYMENLFNNIESKIWHSNKTLVINFFMNIKKIGCLNLTPRKHSQNTNKQNFIPHLGISLTTSKHTSRIFSSQKSSRNKSISGVVLAPKITKMLKLIEHGTFLNKRNYNSDGGEYRFVKITSNLIKWGKNPQKVDQGGQSYPLKDIRGILYGKISPTLNKPQNKVLKSHQCFSLILQKRTLDFYCKDYEEVESWVCGLTVALKKIQQPIIGYTPGKMLWKKMLLILKTNFVQPLKKHERNRFYFENAFAVIQFGKNNYRLVNKHPY